MMMAFNPHRAKIESVTVEYDGKTGRKVKILTSNSTARRFYLKMAAAGKNPRVVAGVASR
jgi:hypothetical protein